MLGVDTLSQNSPPKQLQCKKPRKSRAGTNVVFLSIQEVRIRCDLQIKKGRKGVEQVRVKVKERERE